MKKQIFLVTLLLLLTYKCFGQNYGDSINNIRESQLSSIKGFQSLLIFGSKESLSQKYNGGGSVEYVGVDESNNSVKKDKRYKRISIYSLVTSNHTKPFNIRLINGFGNATVGVPEKYNNHDIGDYIIPLNPIGDVATQIENHLNKNNVAKKLLAKWFRRNPYGEFNMSLIGDRGEYDASFLEKSLAEKSARGIAMLKDAGEELISKTFVCVYDFNFAEQKKTYTVTMDCYLYRLVWDEETASIFYNTYWMDKNSSDPKRKQAFENSSDFKMQYVGMINMGEVMSAEKPMTDAVSYGSKKNSTDYNRIGIELTYFQFKDILKKSYSQLEQTFEEFRTKFPLYSADPIAAKIGKKEDLQVGDRFEVLEKVIKDDGTIEYEQIGIITITDSNQIWDNDTASDWLGTTKSKLPYTVFEGEKDKFASGMLIRKIYTK